MKLIIKLLKPLKHFWKYYFFGFLLLTGFSLGRQYLPIIIQSLLDNDLQNITKNDFLWLPVIQKISTYVILAVSLAIIGFVGNLLLARGSVKVATFLRNSIFLHIQKLPISYFDDKPAGKIATVIVNYTETLQNNFYLGLLVDFANSFFTLIFVYIMSFYLDYKLGLLFLLLIPIFIFWQYGWKKIIQKPLDVFYDVQSDINVQINEMMNSSEILQLYKQADKYYDKFVDYSEKMLNAEFKINKLHSFLGYNLSSFFEHLFTAIILSYVGYSFLKGNSVITVGNLFVALAYSRTIFESMSRLVQLLPNVFRSLNTGKRILAILEEEAEVEKEKKLEIKEGKIEFRDVSFAYKEDTLVLRDINFKINSGEVAAFVGHTGSGKTSIMNLLFRFYDPQVGKILIDNQDIGDCVRESVRLGMGIVLQTPYLFTGTIASNVRMERDDLSDAEVENYLKKVGATDLLARLPEGIYTPVLEKGKVFSSGERQLISFARTLASNPKIIILDEATSHIDTETEEIIQNALKILQQGRTTLIIAHRLSTIQNSDKIFVLEKGKLVEEGNHSSLMQLNGIYASMYRHQAGEI